MKGGRRRVEHKEKLNGETDKRKIQKKGRTRKNQNLGSTESRKPKEEER